MMRRVKDWGRALVVCTAMLSLFACDRKPFDLAVGIPMANGRYPLLPEYAARRGQPYAALSTSSSEIARKAVADIVGRANDRWVERQGISAIWLANHQYCYPTGMEGGLRINRVTPEVARGMFHGCKAQKPEALDVDGSERFALVRLTCSPRSNGWQMVPKHFEVRAAIAIENEVALGAISFDVGDPHRMIPVTGRKRPCEI